MAQWRHRNQAFNLPNAFSIVILALDNFQPKYFSLVFSSPWILFIKKGNRRKGGSPIKQAGIASCLSTKTFSHFGISPYLNFLLTEEFKNILES